MTPARERLRAEAEYLNERLRELDAESHARFRELGDGLRLQISDEERAPDALRFWAGCMVDTLHRYGNATLAARWGAALRAVTVTQDDLEAQIARVREGTGDMTSDEIEGLDAALSASADACEQFQRLQAQARACLTTAGEKGGAGGLP